MAKQSCSAVPGNPMHWSGVMGTFPRHSGSHTSSGHLFRLIAKCQQFQGPHEKFPACQTVLLLWKKKNTAIYCLFSAGPPYLPKIISPDIKMFSFLPVRPSFLGSPLVMRFPTVASVHSSLLDPWSLQLSNFDGPHPLQVNAQGSYFTSNPWTLCDAYWLSHCTSVQDFRGENSPREFQLNLTRRSQ